MLLPKVSIVPALLLSAGLAAAASRPSAASPQRISFESLLNGGRVGSTANTNNDGKANTNLLLDGLTTNGLISITDIPSFQQTKIALMSHLHACIMSTGDAPMTQRFDDGTIRRSFATATSPSGGGQLPLKTLDEYEEQLLPESKMLSSSCQHFKDHLSSFRSTVDLATREFANRLSIEMGTSLPTPLLSTTSNDGRSADYDDIKQVVEGGQHLEHFHSYQKIGGDGGGESTIEFHTDQGFFIAFSPGLIVSSEDENSIQLSDGFYIQDANGDTMVMEFTMDDDLVFMMGDGVLQFINDKLTDGKKALRSTPHALTLPALEDASKARVWYGRMVLAPSDSAIGETREFLVETSSNGESIPVGIGCSSSNMKAVIQTSRHLQDEGCAEGEFYCWFRCQVLADHDLTVDTCDEMSTAEGRDLKLQCVNPRGQVHPTGKVHGDFFPMCTEHTNETSPVTPYPMIEQQDEEACTLEAWEEFMDADSYDHMVELTQPNGTETKLFWSIVEDDEGAKKVKARLAFDNVFGWLAMGFTNTLEGAPRNGMNGASILMAIPGGNYKADTGLDMEADGSIATYKIHETESAFRHWQDPIENDETMTTIADYEDTGCFSSISFESDHINGIKFNLDGTDDLIWGGNSVDHWVGYHTREHRARFTLDWNTGEMSFFGEEEETVNEEPEGDEDKDTTAVSTEADDTSGAFKNGVIGIMTLAFAPMMQYLYAN